jgi:hypothetical protein
VQKDARRPITVHLSSDCGTPRDRLRSRTLRGLMSEQPGRGVTSRAEARRRARLAARGEDLEADEYDEDEDPGPPPRQGFLSRLIPPAPPLPGKGDPLAGFSYEGPLRPLVEALYLLRANPLAWLAPGLAWLVLSLLPPADPTLGLIGSVGQYIALIAAGWIGWQRPWLYGLTAALLPWLVIVVVYIAIPYANNPQSLNPGGPVPALGDIIASIVVRTLLQVVVGLIAGWYGGYLRRRLADQRPRQAASTPRRR